jgi:ATP-dependent exoDNAse (exonuclease V) beta subunit
MDRVMIDNDHVVVIDYKTGIFRNEHKKQVKEYKEILRQMGYNKVEGYLLYLSNGELISI